jgi:perosamine synthetase
MMCEDMPDDLSMSAPDLDEADERAVLDALRSGVLGLGPFAERFEALCARAAGTAHAVAVSSGTAGLHLIVRALGITRGDEVLVPSFTFAASANAFIYEGGTPVFVDIDPETFNLDPAEINARRTSDTRAVMVVDIFGQPADWQAIEQTATDLLLIEDSCEALGGKYRGRPAGSFGRAGCFAFYPNKQVTTGEGGMIVTDEPALFQLCQSMRNQGRGEMGSWLNHERLGFNYRMDELSAALGVSQIQRLDAILAKRARVAEWYTQRLASLEWVRPPTIREEVDMSWFVYVVTLDRDIDRDSLVETLATRGVPSRAYFSPLHLEPYIRDRFGTREGMLPVTEDIARRTLALPFHNKITESQVDRVVRALEDARAARS